MLLLLACGQGLFLAVLIFHRHRVLYANRFLGVMILGYSLVLLHLFLGEIRFSFNHPVIPFLAIGLVFLVGPLHYLYAKYLVRNRPGLLKVDRLGVSPHNLSEVINTRLNLNFFDFINGYRMKKVMADLADPEKTCLKVLAIAYDTGFNSKTSFNTLFKKATGKTPTQYRLSAGRQTADR